MHDSRWSICALGASLSMSGLAGAAEVWTGPTITFTKPNGADWLLEENQDRITDLVWITRADFQGIFNIAVEDAYEFGSPADTEWAFGAAEDWQNLTFEPWVVWHDDNPGNFLGVPSVLHLITEDIYIDITFLDWSCCGDGGFSYERSTVPAPSVLPLLAGGALVGFRPRRRGG